MDVLKETCQEKEKELSKSKIKSQFQTLLNKHSQKFLAKIQACFKHSYGFKEFSCIYSIIDRSSWWYNDITPGPVMPVILRSVIEFLLHVT